MTESDEPTMTVENRLDTMGEGLSALRVLGEHHQAKIEGVADVQGKHGQSLEEHARLLQSLRVLYEHHDEQIQRIAEVQVEHGKRLGEIKDALEPLPAIHDFVKRIASEHEVRITALEKPSS